MIIAIIHQYTVKIASWYRYAKENGELSFWIVFAVTVYLPFEEFVIKFTPFRGIILFGFRVLTTEFIIFALFLKLIYEIIFRGKQFKRTPLDILFIALLCSIFISIIINKAQIIESLVNIRPIFRYIPLYYVVVHLDISREKLSLTLKTIRRIGLFQSLLATFQYFAPVSISNFFLPLDTGVSVGGYQRSMLPAKTGAALGTMGISPNLTTFSLISLSLFITTIYSKAKKAYLPSLQEIFWILIIFFSIFATLKRASLVLAVLIPILVLWHLNKRKKALKLGWFYGAIFFGLIFTLLVANFQPQSLAGRDDRQERIEPSAYIIEIFTPEYWEKTSENSRGWMIRYVGSSLLRSEGIWFGFSPAWTTLKDRLIELNKDDPFAQQRFEESIITTFEDTYWLAMLAYYGIIGVLIYLLILWRLYRSCRWLTRNSSDPEYQSLGATVATLIVIYLFYCWVERVWELKTISFYFWLLAGLVTNSYYAFKENAIRRQQMKRIPHENLK
ncbi:MAG: hypothetical protein ACFBSE_05340 [Prochloraceae cyanobacterium]